jgi:hypothetical protein
MNDYTPNINPLEVESTEENIDSCYNSTWSAVDKMKADHGEVWFLSINRPPDLTNDPKRTTFAFDIAIATTRENAEIILRMIYKHRAMPWDSRKVYRSLNKIYEEAEKYPHCWGVFS